MKETNCFENNIRKIFESLFEEQWKDKKIWEHIRDGELTATPAFEGKLYKESKTKIMFVGRDLNGWDCELGDCSSLENTVDSIMNQEGAFDTFVDKKGFGEGKWKYRHKNYNFFRFIKHILEFLGESDEGIDDTWYTDSKNWNQRFVWANLYCISPRNPKSANEAHPDNSMVKLGIENYVDLMEQYINYYKPDAVVFITDLYGWFIRWSRKKSFKDFVTEYNECTDNSTIVTTGKVNSSKIVVCKRPDRRGYTHKTAENMASDVAEWIKNN